MNRYAFRWREGAAILLLLYLAGGLWSPGARFHAHEMPEGSHSEHCQSDPCHAAIYHHDRQAGCSHKSHLIPAPTDECPWDHQVVFRQHLPPCDFLPEPEVVRVSAPKLADEAEAFRVLPLPAGRGPPASLT